MWRRDTLTADPAGSEIGRLKSNAIVRPETATTDETHRFGPSVSHEREKFAVAKNPALQDQAEPPFLLTGSVTDEAEVKRPQ